MAVSMASRPTQYAPISPSHFMARVAAKGPMNTPMRITPPSMDMARA